MEAAPRRLAFLLLAVAAATAAIAAPPEDDADLLPRAAERPIDFESDVLPILATRCLGCHGPTKQKGELRLDARATLLAGGKSGSAIVERDGAHSAILRRAAGLDGKKAMPLSGRRLSDSQLSVLRAWIDQGANWKDGHEIDPDSIEEPRHWAYQPIAAPELPQVAHAERVRRPLDRFIEARLEADGLAPAPEADRATLLRRLSLDLVGLPPSPEEIDAFVADPREDAFETQVDRLLASPHYGEKWARWWLDLARYADTHGHEKDARRTMWRWRDWVIEAFDRDLPFDRFTLEQLAGDLLPDANDDTRLATGFHRNTMKNEEGGVDPEEDRNHVLVDRVNTTATVWLGSTLMCAQCHDHKFDAFTQEDYYRFYAFFADAEEAEVPAPTVEQADETARVLARLEALNSELAAPNAKWDAAFARWAAPRSSEPRFTPLVPASVTSRGAATATIAADGSVLISGENPERDHLVIEARLDPGTITALRLDALTDPSLVGGGPGRGGNGSFVVSKVTAQVALADHPDRAAPVAFSTARADYVQAGHSAESLVDGTDGPGWATDAWKDDGHVARAVVLALAEPLVVDGPATITIEIAQESQWPRATLGKFRLAVTGDARPELAFPEDGAIRAILARAESERSAEDAVRSRTVFRSFAAETRAVRKRLAEASGSIPVPPTTLVMARVTEHRPTHLLRKGNFLDPGPEVSAGVPAVLPQIGAPASGAAVDRLALARWLVSPDNPLTARVIVNRVWAELFGRGLVPTQDDFGVQGEAPSHPELLDFLAHEFVADGWSTKRLIRRLVTSAAWRRSSQVTSESLERDPGNRLLARANRVRVEAETVRDVALSASGLLSEKKFGPSVFPPQPDGVWSMIYSEDRWVASEGEDRHRRGLYTFWRRTAPYPSFVAFDAPSREVTCTRRVPTTTPLQALVTLNDPAFFECAQALARRMEQEGGALSAGRIARGFRLCCGRTPSAKELDRLVAYFEAERVALAGDAEATARLAGEASAVERAALTMVGNVLLNLDETLTRE